MLAVRDEDQLVNSLRDICKIENDIEADKTRLGHCYDFNLTDAFKIFDQRGYGVIDTYELKDGLSAIGLFPTADEVELFVKRYDTNGDRRISRHEFETAFLTLDYYNSGDVRRRGSNYKSPIYRRDDCFSARTADEFRACWRTHFRSENQSEAVRQQLRSNPHFNVYDAFNSLDLNADGRISKDEFRRIITSRGFYVSEKEVEEIVNKMDTNKDGRVSFAEVSYMLQPN